MSDLVAAAHRMRAELNRSQVEASAARRAVIERVVRDRAAAGSMPAAAERAAVDLVGVPQPGEQVEAGDVRAVNGRLAVATRAHQVGDPGWERLWRPAR